MAVGVGGGYENASDMARDLTGGQKFMKYVIMGLSLLYLIFGIVLCATGGAALAGYAASIAGTTLPKGLIVVGAFLIVTAIIGAVSAWFEIRLGLGVYFVSMLIWTIILLAIGIAVLAAKSNLQTYIAAGWALADCGTQQTIQNEFNCCGRYNQGDSYAQFDTGYNSNGDSLWGFGSNSVGGVVEYPTFPSLTCNGQLSTVQNGCPGPWTGQGWNSWAGGASCVESQQWQKDGVNCTTTAQGCVYALKSSLQSSWQAAGGAGIAFAVIMAIGLAFTCFLMRGIQTKGTNAAIDRNRVKTQRDLDDRRRRGKGGLKIPDTVL